VRSHESDLSCRDEEHLWPLVVRCYETSGGAAESPPPQYMQRFLSDIFAGGWSSLMLPNTPPTVPDKRKQLQCSVKLRSLLRDCDGTPARPTPPSYRKAGAPVYCRVKKDPTRLTFDYVDAMGGFIKYTQKDQLGNGP
jgi:hypothetical protein